jgi:6,7-dimethyl-8-ribityllumazine synthase
MIKGITLLETIAGAEARTRVASFFSALGLASGRSFLASGVAVAAPAGAIEFGAEADLRLAVETTNLDAAHQAAGNWLKVNGGQERLGAIAEADGSRRAFTVEPEPGFKLCFWVWSSPLMGKPVAVEGDLSAAGMRFAIVVARWNAVVTERLLEGALDALLRSGARREDITVVRVPGAWEVPAAARTLAQAGQVDAIVALGCLLRGETAHYEAIYNEVARGIGQSQQETGIPHAFGVLTCENLEQALNRAGIKAGNKGFEAGVAAIEMASLRRKLAAKEGQA